VFLETREIRGRKGVRGGVLEMELGEKSFMSPEGRPLFEWVIVCMCLRELGQGK
jgi:hypothetical protein